MAVTIDDLLNALQNPSDVGVENSEETWKRIWNGATFDEFGFDSEEAFSKWKEENEYSNI